MGSAGSAAAPAQESNVNGAGPNLSSFLEAACPRYAAVKVSLCLEWPQKSPIVENLLVLFPSCLTVLLAVLSLFFKKKLQYSPRYSLTIRWLTTGTSTGTTAVTDCRARNELSLFEYDQPAGQLVRRVVRAS